MKRASEQYHADILSIWQSPGSLDEVIRHCGEICLSIVEENPRRWLVLFSGSVVPVYGELGNALAELRQGKTKMITALIRANAPKIDNERAEAIAQAIFAVGDHFSRWWLYRPEIPKERLVGYLTDFISHGLSQLVPEHPQLATYFNKENAH